MSLWDQSGLRDIILAEIIVNKAGNREETTDNLKEKKKEKRKI